MNAISQGKFSPKVWKEEQLYSFKGEQLIVVQLTATNYSIMCFYPLENGISNQKFTPKWNPEVTAQGLEMTDETVMDQLMHIYKQYAPPSLLLIRYNCGNNHSGIVGVNAASIDIAEPALL